MDETAKDGQICLECGCARLENCREGLEMLPERRARVCPNRRGRIIEHRLAAASVPERYVGCTLDGFRSEGLAGAAQLAANREACRSYLDRFRLDGEARTARGLLLVGPAGTGKTHLLAAVLQAVIRGTGARGIFADFTSVCAQIQDSFDNPELSEAGVLRPLLETQVLALDELGARRPTPFVMDTLYLVINTRYARRLPTLFSTNHPPEAAATARPRLDRPAVRSSAAEIAEDAFEPLSLRIGSRITSRLFEATEHPALMFDQAADYRRLRS